MNNNFNNVPFEGSGFNTIPTDAPHKSGRGFAIASMVLGIVAVCLCCCCCGILYWVSGLLGVLAIVFAILTKTSTGKFHGMAIAGLILGILAILLFLMMLSLDIWAASVTPEEFAALMRDLIDDEEVYEEYMDMMRESGMWESFFANTDK